MKFLKKKKQFLKLNLGLEKKNYIEGVTKEDIFITINKKDRRTFKVNLKYDGPIKAPIKKGQEIAVLQIYEKEELKKTVPIYALNELKKVNFIKSLFLSLNYLVWGDA